jgi:uncharacterized membrane protein
MTGHPWRSRTVSGIVLIATGLLFNPWLLGYLIADDGSIGSPAMFDGILLFSIACVLGGAHLLVGWVNLLVHRRPVHWAKAAAIVLGIAALVAATHWRLSTYRMSHGHTMEVHAEHQHATPEQEQWARDFYQRSLDAAIKNGWFDINNALAQGFQADRINGTHFPHLQYMFDDVLLDPERPEWLVYDDSPNGKVLMALMFFTRRLDEAGPTHGGPIAQWHFHPYSRPRCAVKGLWTIGYTDDDGTCAEGEPVTRTPEMLHVWFMDHPLGNWTSMKIVPDYREDEQFDVARLHPFAVHFAIALFMIAVLLDGAGMVSRNARFHWAAWLNLSLAGLATLLAVGAGITAEMTLTPTAEIRSAVQAHKLWSFSGMGVVGVLVLWRLFLGGAFPRRWMAVPYVAATLAGVVLIGGASYRGNELVYRHGAGVRAMDTFLREAYWNRVHNVYRPSGKAADHSDHH